MYEIYEGVKVELNRVTPYSVKLYKERIIENMGGTKENIKQALEADILNASVGDENKKELDSKELFSMLDNAINKSAIGSLDIFLDKQYVEKWIDVIFKITPEQIKIVLECDWDAKDCKFSWDEFARGHKDFFMRALMLLS